MSFKEQLGLACALTLCQPDYSLRDVVSTFLKNLDSLRLSQCEGQLMPAGFANLSSFCCSLQKISPCLADPGRLTGGVSSVIYSSSALKVEQVLVNMYRTQKETLTIFRRQNHCMVCVAKRWFLRVPFLIKSPACSVLV